MYIPVVLGTGREGRNSERVAKFVLRILKEKGFETELVDVRDFESARTVAKWAPDETSERWREIVKKSDKIFLVTPEYNFSFPGELKILFDRLMDDYNDKEIFVGSVSAGPFAGVRVVEELKHYLTSLGFNFRGAVNFGHVADEFTEDGETENEKHEERVLGLFE
jgi:NAD(P)H-dependent FMN reductase